MSDDFRVPRLARRGGEAPSLGRASAIGHLKHLLTDEQSHIRMRAAYALGGVGASYPQQAGTVLADLEDRLHTDPLVMVRVAAGHALGRIGVTAVADRQRIIRTLMQVLADPRVVYVVKLAAAEGVGSIGPLLTTDRLTQEKAALALMQALRTEHFAVRENAARALGQIGAQAEPRLCELIVRALARTLHADDRPLVMAAAWALGLCADPSAVPALIAQLDNDGMPAVSRYSHVFHLYGGTRVCDVAAGSLARIGTPDALAALDSFRVRDA
ncbi:MAG: HEAT repeat domain-containing protein [Chloroflexi bacterium]|nr:HEAT repeat domain-containing protein [Chloroflexota bacterium]